MDSYAREASNISLGFNVIKEVFVLLDYNLRSDNNLSNINTILTVFYSLFCKTRTFFSVFRFLFPKIKKGRNKTTSK